MVPRENKNNANAKFGGTNKEYHCIFRNGLLHYPMIQFFINYIIQISKKKPAAAPDILVNFEISLAVFIPNTLRNRAISFTNTSLR